MGSAKVGLGGCSDGNTLGRLLLGRLELFTVLILFTPYYWTKH